MTSAVFSVDVKQQIKLTEHFKFRVITATLWVSEIIGQTVFEVKSPMERNMHRKLICNSCNLDAVPVGCGICSKLLFCIRKT